MPDVYKRQVGSCYGVSRSILCEAFLNAESFTVQDNCAALPFQIADSYLYAVSYTHLVAVALGINGDAGIARFLAAAVDAERSKVPVSYTHLPACFSS